MGSGHRPGHRRRGREGSSSPPSGDRTLVLPGEELPHHGLQPGPGTYRVRGKIYASVLGLVSARPPEVRVIPLSGRYIPRAGDLVIGTVTDVQPTFWLLDIAAPRWAPLHMTGTPWKIEFGETKQYLRVGDSVVVQVENLESSGRIGVTMIGERLGKLDGGTIATISPAKIPRVIGRGGSMLETILRHTRTRIVAGQNGRVWVDGEPEEIARVRECLRLIDTEGQRPGLTERIQRFLEGREAPPASFGPGSEPWTRPVEASAERPPSVEEERVHPPDPLEGAPAEPGAAPDEPPDRGDY